ncbi:MAG: carbohydrate kinase [Thermodesulfobacteriota bacterium]|nr:carbohydrate kinase [Thermodesulfobacteriota bacterium]
MTQIQPVIFGEVLFDCFPDGSEVLGGAPFNVAWHLNAFGMLPAFISRIGEDRRGRKIEQAMTGWIMETSFLQRDSQRPTGIVKVHLENGEPKYDISPEDAYGHIQMKIPKLPEDVPILYHGSLALWFQSSRDALEKVKQKCQAPVFIDVNLRHPWWQSDTVLSLLEGASWVKLNEEELNLLSPLPEGKEQKVEVLLERFQLQSLILTQGSQGATVYLQEGTQLSVVPASDIQIVDTVGAGDAFSAVFILGLMSNWPLQKIIDSAQDFASAIICKRGAIVTDHRFYTSFVNKWVAT